MCYMCVYTFVRDGSQPSKPVRVPCLVLGLCLVSTAQSNHPLYYQTADAAAPLLVVLLRHYDLANVGGKWCTAYDGDAAVLLYRN
jgi:hypothetical protein